MPHISKRKIQARAARTKRERYIGLEAHRIVLSGHTVPTSRRVRHYRTVKQRAPLSESCPTPCFPLYTCQDCMQKIPGHPHSGLERCNEPESGEGSGLTTSTAIDSGTFIICYTGKRHRQPCQGPYVLEVLQGRLWLDGETDGNLSRYINHSCTPNCEVYVEPATQRAMIFAIAPILPGEELTIKYTPNRSDLPFLCQCRSCQY